MRPEYEEIIARLDMIPHGPEYVGLLEELVRRADANNDIEMAYPARRELTSVANEEGFPEKAIVAHSWCMAQFDKDEEIDDWAGLLWQYKVILEMIPVFASVSREQIIRMQEDMATRLTRYGESERTAHYYRSWNLMRMGDYEEALQYQETYLNMPRTMISDCEACERDRQIELLSRMKCDEQSLQFAADVLSGRMRCGEVPEFTHGHVVRSLLRLGRVDEAIALQPNAYAMIRDERKYLGTIGDLLLVLVRASQFDQAMPIVLRHLPWARETSATELRFRFYSAVALFFESLALERPATLKLLLPRELSCWRDDDQYDPASLATWFSNEAQTLANQFDARNGNTAYQSLLADNRTLAGRT